MQGFLGLRWQGSDQWRGVAVMPDLLVWNTILGQVRKAFSGFWMMYDV